MAPRTSSLLRCVIWSYTLSVVSGFSYGWTVSVSAPRSQTHFHTNLLLGGAAGSQRQSWLSHGQGNAGSPSQLQAKSSTASVAYDDHAAEVFNLIDGDGNGRIDKEELQEVLRMLNIDASEEDIGALFKHLDIDGNQEVEYDEFLSWYVSAASSAQSETNVVMDTLLSRRTVNDFDSSSEVPDSVLKNAVLAAIHAPNHGMTEPWNFIQLGKKSISEIAALNADSIKDPLKAEAKRERWEKIPGWCVVTCKKNSEDKIKEQEDYAATCCAIQNFQLAMWAEGVGTKWTTGPITRTYNFAKICGLNMEKQTVVGCIWYGFASGGLASVRMPKRKQSVDDVLSKRP